MAVLPPLSKRKNLSFPWFPSRAHAFIFRNWEMITPESMARVLETDEGTVLGMAARMGLPPSSADEERWLAQGYITVIRANWHLITYEQLASLLGWTMDYLAFIIQEDDFLGHKLGREKPDVPPLRVEPATTETEEKEARIRDTVREAYAAIGERRVAPFEFAVTYPSFEERAASSRFDATFCYSYCALYGDTFASDELIEKSFPDELLRSYQAMGIGGVWTQAVLYAMTPCEVNPSLSVGWEKRIRGLNRVIARLQKYGLKLYLYINEPREMALDFFEKYPDWKGDERADYPGYASICLSNPAVQDFLRESIYFLTKNAPGLGGYITITASENHTNCYSHKRTGETTCPRCRALKRSDLYALANRLIYEGAAKADPEILVMAYSWAWDVEEGCLEETLDRLPGEIAVLGVSERNKPKTTLGVTVPVADYSISVPGPSEYMEKLFRLVRERGMRTVAKVQMNVSWELCPMPYLPVFGHFYQAIRDLTERVNPDILMLTWTHGGHPAPPMRMMSRMTERGGEIPSLPSLLRELFPEAEGEALEEAIACFDRAFDEYPFSVGTMYNGPQHMGVSAPLFPEKTGWAACMIGPTYDDIQGWASSCFTPEMLCTQYEKMTSLWKEGMPLLEEALLHDSTREGKLLLEVSRASLYHIEAAYLHMVFVLAREAGESSRMREVVRAHQKLALREARLMNENPGIGYEASNHYLFTRQDLLEKTVNCRYLLDTL